jgi:hypothetical protein
MQGARAPLDQGTTIMKLLAGMTSAALLLISSAILSAPAFCWLASMLCCVHGVHYHWHV